MNTTHQEIGRRIFKAQGESLGKLLDTYVIEETRMSIVAEYAIAMLAKNPHMKLQRIARKTVEYFKLKPKQKTDESNTL